MRSRSVAALAAALGASCAARGVVNTHIDVLASRDGVNYSSTIGAFPGDTIQVVISVSYIGTASPLGLSALIFQPTVSGFRTNDTPLAFVNGGAGGNTSTPLGTAPDVSGQYGRISPWARTFLSTNLALTYFNNNSVGQPAGNWLRIAQRQVTAWIGGSNNTTGGSGVNCAQLSNVGRTTSDPAFNFSLTNIHVFRFGFTIDTAGPITDYLVDLPQAGFGNRNSTTGDREVQWFAELNEPTGSIRGAAEVVPATIILTPGPGVLGVLGLGGLAGTRRRRDESRRA